MQVLPCTTIVFTENCSQTLSYFQVEVGARSGQVGQAFGSFDGTELHGAQVGRSGHQGHCTGSGVDPLGQADHIAGLFGQSINIQQKGYADEYN